MATAVKTAYNSRFSLHTSNVNIYTIKASKPAALSFSKRDDAILFGKLLEGKFNVDKQWPMFEMSDMTNWSIKIKNEDEELCHIFVTEWEADSFQNVCINHNIANVNIESAKFSKDTLKLKGIYVSWDVDPTYYVDYFNVKYKES
jgi:hypothetical protein